MTNDRLPIERLQDYLQSLPPPARGILIALLEHAPDNGNRPPLIKSCCRNRGGWLKPEPAPVPPMVDLAHRFFMPIEPFLIDAPADHKRIGRLARVSLEPIWNWLRRDLMPAEASAFNDDISRALAADDAAKADQLLRALQDRACQRIGETLSAVGDDEKARRRLGVEVGTPRVIEDLTLLTRILGLRDMLGELARRLPSHVRAFERGQTEQVKALLDNTAQKLPAKTAVQKSDLFLFGLIILMNRLGAPWQLVRIASNAASSDNAARIAETPYAVAVAIVLNELEGMVSELRVELKAARPVASLLKRIHDAAREIHTEIDLSDHSAWSRQLAALRAAAANLLTAEIEATPGKVRRLLRPRPANEIMPGSLLDAMDVEEAAARVDLVAACRLYAGELAVSEVTLRAHSELTQYLETSSRMLLDALRQSDDAERPFRQSQIDAAVRFCKTLFGGEYAGALAKAADVAMQDGAREAKRVPA